ncbi:hypothetical protein CEY16_11140 [Halalkalibacillus sediminis]|uniref:Uncharacterized protein n=1 Tax=Halalkalibacillus sediminis TaxID=2018042 RepID=A0A2I0QSF6_9BACI|nr:hypothetical protein [Halalkalibacillus sediminis]PKR77285.1 hypothetical protein CEY16_11140 [Halalkalibacillus sediminis]
MKTIFYGVIGLLIVLMIVFISSGDEGNGYETPTWELHAELANDKMKEESSVEMYKENNLDKFEYDMSDESVEGFMQLDISDTRVTEANQNVLFGSGSGGIQINQQQFPFQFNDMSIQQYDHDGDRIFQMELVNVDLTNSNREQDQLHFRIVWNETTDKQYMSGRVGPSNDHSILIFGEKFIGDEELTEDDLVPFDR